MDNIFLCRGKRVDNGEWVQGNYVEDCFWGQHCIFCKPYRYPIEIDPSTRGQCTGLIAAKSYRGESEADRLIFEGDICKDSLGFIFSVIWDDENARFIGKHDKPRGDTYICYIGREPNPVEIIGAIHDTPELLEG